MSLFANYIVERGGKNIIENEHGFVTYIIGGRECYLEDMYVVPEKRKTHVGSALANAVIEHAKEYGCTTLLTSVVPSMNGSSGSTAAILAYGFRLLKSEPNFIVFIKDI